MISDPFFHILSIGSKKMDETGSSTTFTNHFLDVPRRGPKTPRRLSRRVRPSPRHRERKSGDIS
jgi:hypothetical protein